MIEDFSCPVCNTLNWHTIERFRFARRSGSRSQRVIRKLARLIVVLAQNGPSTRPLHGEIVATQESCARTEVFFDLWFGGAATANLQTIYCEQCGFACYSPRPAERDLDAKYMHLAAARRKFGEQDSKSLLLESLDLRQRRIVRLLGPHLKQTPSDILDFGGSQGHLIAAFATQGHRCHVVDYGDRTAPGVIRLGQTIHDVDDSSKFDLIVCSHVLEHLAEPVKILVSLRELLARTGKIYVEVPLEIHGCVRIEHDPVTHVNFFTPASLENAARAAGLRVTHKRLERVWYGDTEIDAVWVIAECNETGRDGPLVAPDIAKHLHLGRRRLMLRYIKQTLSLLGRYLTRSHFGRRSHLT
jgi:SAM-dependent methyltransferase